ncbi:MAG: hypothetical protein GC164_11070 [Phycisphaera sp.]|nr:hypothetical protein [Phycisphaera sp.]
MHSTSNCRGFGMWRRGNTGQGRLWRRVNTLAPSFVVICMGLLCFELHAQEPAQLKAPLPDASHVRWCFDRVESAVSDVAAGREREVDGHTQQVTGVVGVRVTLRWLGMTLATGDAWLSEPIVMSGLPTDLGALTESALASALKQLNAAARESELRGAERTGQPVSLESVEARVRSLASSTLVDVQLAYNLQALPRPPAGMGLDGLEKQLMVAGSPYAHGLVALRQQEGSPLLRAVVWPGSALAMNQSLMGQWAGMLHDVGYAATALQDPNQGVWQDPSLWLGRFDTLQRVRPAQDLPATQLVRGNVLLPPVALDLPTVDWLIRHVADHLLALVREDGSLVGTFHPTSDTFDPVTAPDADAALWLYAVARRINQLKADATQPGNLQRFIDAYTRVSKTLEKRRLALDAQPEPATDALLLLASLESPLGAAPQQRVETLTARLLALRDNESQFTDHGQPIGSPTQAIILAALAKAYERSRDEKLWFTLGESLDKLWASTAPGQRVSQLPWIAMAHFTVARLDPGTSDTMHKLYTQRSLELRSLSEALLAKQVRPPLTAEQGSTDVVGGVDLQPVAGSSMPWPDWNTARFVWLWATLLQQPGVIPFDDRVTCLLGAGLGARFLAQLTYDAPSCFYVRNTPLALGGVRSALWDNRLTLSPSAMTLLALIDLQHAIEGFDK